MKYDDASWHYEGNFPEDLPTEAGATHIGMFLSWMLLNGYASEELLDDAEEEIEALQERSLTGAQFLIRVLDEKLTDEDFSEEGNAFAVAYYTGLDNDSRYLDDYTEAFDVSTDADSIYTVADSWENHDKLAVLIEARHSAWKAAGCPEYIV